MVCQPGKGWAENGLVVVGPPSATMSAKIAGGGVSFVSSAARARAARLIQQMDEGHKRRLKGSGITFQEPAKIEEWIYERTSEHPKAVPLPERAMLVALALQIDMLDKLLFIRNSRGAERLRAERLTHRILDRKQRIFGDYRDVFVEDVLEALRHIAQLQNALWPGEERSFAFPVDLKTASEAEEYLLSKILIIARKAGGDGEF
jgi:hypothetical protein